MAPACWSAFKSPLTWFALVALTFAIEKNQIIFFTFTLFSKHEAKKIKKDIELQLLIMLKKEDNFQRIY